MGFLGVLNANTERPRTVNPLCSKARFLWRGDTATVSGETNIEAFRPTRASSDKMHPVLGQHKAAFICICSINPEMNQGVGERRTSVKSWIGIESSHPVEDADCPPLTMCLLKFPMLFKRGTHIPLTQGKTEETSDPNLPMCLKQTNHPVCACGQLHSRSLPRASRQQNNCTENKLRNSWDF